MSLNKLNELKDKNLFIILIILILIVVVYGVLFSYLGVNSQDGKMHFLRLFLLGIFTFLVLVNGLKYFFDYDLVDNVESVEKKEDDGEVTAVISLDGEELEGFTMIKEDGKWVIDVEL